MGTTQLAAALFQLQQLDLEMDRLLAEQQALTTALQNDASVRKARAELAHIQQQLVRSSKEQQESEQVLADLVRRLKNHEQHLYGGAVSNPKELANLEHEIQNLRIQQTRQEEAVLELMETVETLNAAVTEKTAALSEAERAWQTANATGLTRREQLEVQQQELHARRDAQATGLPAEILQRYESLRKTRQGRAVSKVEQNSCQWCRVILTPSELQRVRVSSDLQTCSNCGRLLYYDR